MGIIQGQKGMFGKGGLLGEGVFRKGVFRGGGAGGRGKAQKNH